MITPPHTRQIEDLQALLQVTRELAANTELLPLLTCVEQAARRVLGCERATVFLYDTATDELVSQLATGVEEIRFSADRGTESLENEDLEEAVRYGVLLREQPLRKEPGRR